MIIEEVAKKERERKIDMNEKKKPAKRVSLVSVKLVRESSILYSNRKIRNPEDAYLLLKDFLEDKDREHLIVVGLDSKTQPTMLTVAHIGAIGSCIVSGREIMKPLILSNATSFIVGHNHPSTDTTPSNADIECTKRLKKVGELMDIQLRDHLIIGENSYVSLKEEGVF